MKPSTATADRDIKPFSSWSIWLVLGAPTATLALVTVYCSGTLLWLLWGSAFGPNRHFYEFAALPLMVLLICIVTFIEASLAQAAAFVAVILFAIALRRWTGRVRLVPLLLASPLLGLFTWFGYENFVPGYRFFLDERPPYEYGLTLERFLYAWGFEALVLLGYWWLIRTFGEADQTS